MKKAVAYIQALGIKKKSTAASNSIGRQTTTVAERQQT